MVLLFDQFHLPKDVLSVVFATSQQALVARLLVEEFKKNQNSLGKTEMSIFATRLHTGFIIAIPEDGKKAKDVEISYNKRQFYDRILTPMKSMGLVDYDLYKKRYMLSDKFVDGLKSIGNMWVNEIAK